MEEIKQQIRDFKETGGELSLQLHGDWPISLYLSARANDTRLIAKLKNIQLALEANGIFPHTATIPKGSNSDTPKGRKNQRQDNPDCQMLILNVYPGNKGTPGPTIEKKLFGYFKELRNMPDMGEWSGIG